MPHQNVHSVSPHSFFIPWPQKRPNVSIYYQDEKLRIILMYEICENVKIFHKIRPTDQVICALPWSIEDDYMLLNHRRFLDLWNLNPKNFCILANEEKQIQLIKKWGFKSIYCNQNCFLDERIFYPIDCKKEYDAVLNSKLVEFKRPYLANKVSNLLLLAGLSPIEVNIPNHKHIVKDLVGTNEICKYINQSKTGLMLSKEEGPNWSVGELLLSGIPVISTKSVGGRDVWFTDYNSLICDDNEESVANVVKQMIDKKPSPHKIREDFLELSYKFRDNFVNYTNNLFCKAKIKIDAHQYFIDNFQHKMIARSNNYDDLCQLLSF